MDNLFPEEFDFESKEYVLDSKKRNLELLNRQSYKFDFITGELVKDYRGRITLIDRYEGYIQWCYMCLNTERYSKLAYGRYYGVEFERLRQKYYPQDYVEMEVKRMVAEALLVHPYTKEVKDFKFTWIDNGKTLIYEYIVDTELNVSFTLKGAFYNE